MTALKLAGGGALVAVAVVAAGILVLAFLGGESGTDGLLGGFDHPRTVHLAPDGRLIITDLGTGDDDGRVVAVDLQSGDRTVLMSQLPSTRDSGQRYADLAGPSGGSMARDGTVCAVIGDANRPGRGFGTMRCSNGLTVDLKQFEEEHNPDGREIASNPYDIVSDESGGWYVSDAAANAVLHINHEGAIRVAGTFTTFCCLANQGAQSVPTGLHYLANGRGDIRVATVALFGGAVAMLREGQPEVGIRLADLPRVIGVVDDGKEAYFLVHDDGTSADGSSQPHRGRIVDAMKQDVVTGLDRPTGFTRLPDGRFVVVEETRGRVRIVHAE